MSNVLSEEKRQQVVALGRLGWPLRRIEAATGVRRETASEYLRAAGVKVVGRGRRGSKPAITQGVSTDSGRVETTTAGEVSAGLAEVEVKPTRAPSASACEVYRGEITQVGQNFRENVVVLVDEAHRTTSGDL